MRWLVNLRAFQYLLILPGLVVFILVILTGIYGNPNGAHNLSIVFVWILWWFFLIAFLVPFGSRVWCAVCPIPAAGEWLQRGALIGKPTVERPRGLGLKWPRRLRNIWFSTFFFMGIAIFSIYLTTTPVVTAVLMALLIGLAVAVHLVFEKRTFCKYVCPVGGFLSLYSMTSILEVRARDPTICEAHVGKECVKGSNCGFGCPWMNYPGGLDRNNYCGLCLECVKACPYDNMTVRTRPFGRDLLKPHRETAEAFKSLIMLNLALLYLVVLLGPNAWLKDWASMRAGLPSYLLFVAIFFGSSLLLMPGAFFAFSWLAKRVGGLKGVPVKRVFVTYAYALVPLGLAAWIAFSIPLMQINWAYIPQAAADPYGWGWDLLGLKSFSWNPFLPGLVPFVQASVLLLGLAYSVFIGSRIANELTPDRARARRSFLPIAAYLNLVSLGFLWIFIG
ncbi:MAG TPA: 4Fe-4S binding protein [Candidatus Thermoplasmatota archaeon]|nr:4Fe-4S binding protein [Candidatus Thermoplasmatota archaeon]